MGGVTSQRGAAIGLFKHPVKPGRVTIPGHPGDDLHPGALKSVLKSGRADGKQ